MLAMVQDKKVLDSFIIYLDKELNYSFLTIKNYKGDIFDFFDFLNKENKKYLEIQKEDVKQYLKFLGSSELSNKSISRKLSSLRTFYNFLLEVKLIKFNLFNGLKNPRVEKKLPNYLNEEELKMLFSSFELNNFIDVRNYLVLELIYSCGLRLSEAVNLKVKDISLDTMQIKVLGKGSKERFVYFGEYAKEFIMLYLNNYYGKYNKSSEYLFINKFGDNLSVSSIQKMLKKQCFKAGIKRDVSVHSLRHSFATDLLNNGASIDTVKELLGHSSLSTTQIYTHVASEKLKSVYKSAHPRNERID